LSEFWARYPSNTYEFGIHLQRVLQSNSRLYRAFVIWFYDHQEVIPKWLIAEIEEQLDLILTDKTANQKGQIHKEAVSIRLSAKMLSRRNYEALLTSVYSQRNLSKWKETIEKILDSKAASMCYFHTAEPKTKVRRRGYRESHSNKHKSKNQKGEVLMSRENRSLEEIRESILKKQMILFEQRLDHFLQIQDQDIPPDQRKELFVELGNSFPTNPTQEDILNQLGRKEED
jgi:hypothetical protein